MKSRKIVVIAFVLCAALASCKNESLHVDVSPRLSEEVSSAENNSASDNELIDTMFALKGNTNANLNNGSTAYGTWHAIIWQNRLFWRHPVTHDLMMKDLASRENNEEVSANEAVVLIPQSYPRYFNIWQDQLYVNLKNDFVQINEEGNVQRIVEENVEYCQIHDGWLYFLRVSDGRLCRRLLVDGETQDLGIIKLSNELEVFDVVITDQHIFVNNGFSIFSMNLDGSASSEIVSYRPEDGLWYLKGLDYAEGLLYVSVGGNSIYARICSFNTDGTVLSVIIDDGATEINIVGDWLYYTRIIAIGELEFTDGEKEIAYGGVQIARVKLDGSNMEVLTPESGPYRSKVYDSPTVMPDGSVYYRFSVNNSSDIWYRVN